MPNSRKTPTPAHVNKETMAAAENTQAKHHRTNFNLISFRTHQWDFTHTAKTQRKIPDCFQDNKMAYDGDSLTD